MCLFFLVSFVLFLQSFKMPDFKDATATIIGSNQFVALHFNYTMCLFNANDEFFFLFWFVLNSVYISSINLFWYCKSQFAFCLLRHEKKKLRLKIKQTNYRILVSEVVGYFRLHHRSHTKHGMFRFNTIVATNPKQRRRKKKQNKRRQINRHSFENQFCISALNIGNSHVLAHSIITSMKHFFCMFLSDKE